MAAKSKPKAKPKAKAKAKAKAAPKKKAPKKKEAPRQRVIVQFTRNRRNIGKPQVAPAGADDVHFVWKIPPGVIAKAWWTKGGRRLRTRLPVPRGANDVHVRIR